MRVNYWMELLSACMENDIVDAADAMNADPNIDISFQNGAIFWFIIKHNNPDLLRMLLEYYEKNNMQGDSNSLKYKEAKYKLQQWLGEQVDDSRPSKEILKVLKKYMPQEDSSTDQDASSLENSVDFDSKEMQQELEEIRTANAILSQRLINRPI
ncbi:unnamed protein product [Blepharisma stoltei]|uniref:Uncharacterized protein n=1 Tax=Blepharisma stoltei TaxID=1481888 RepID=A0AAU9KNB5_9CILI|nr:unnamed protein product [Blepharisma stoltei]